MHALVRRAAARLAVLVALFVAAPVAAQPAGGSATAPDPWLQQDVAAYAALYGVGDAVALDHLRLQQASVAVTEALRARWRDRLAGLSVDQSPAFRIDVLLTGDAPVPDELVDVAGTPLAIHYRTGAVASAVQLLGALNLHGAEIRAAVPHPPAMGVNPRTGALAVLVGRSDADAIGLDALTERLTAIAGVPVEVHVLGEVQADMAVEGGARVTGLNPADGRRYACTTGFVVRDDARFGIATAAHCPDDLSYLDADGQRVALPFVGQWGWGYRDVQVNESQTPLAARFYSDTGKSLQRPVTGARHRDATRVGDFVCHRGERTGYSCAEVSLIDFAPAGDLCGGACTPTWIAVAGPGCKAGDSGGPVFLGSTAFGILKGGSYAADGRCDLYFYMSTDFLPQGWQLAIAPPGVTSSPSPPPGSATS